MNNEKFDSILGLKKGIIDEIIKELTDLGVTQIDEVTEIESKIGKTIKIITNNKKEYYIGLSSYGFLEVIREDSKNGKIVYCPIDD